MLRLPRVERTAERLRWPALPGMVSTCALDFSSAVRLVLGAASPQRMRRSGSELLFAERTSCESSGMRRLVSRMMRRSGRRRGRLLRIELCIPLRSVSCGSSARTVPMPVRTASEAWRRSWT